MDLPFFPIFSSRGEAPRAAADSMSRAKPMPKSRLLLRRLVTLLAIGLAHYVLLWQGEILTVYAVLGLLVLLPSTWLPRWAVAGLSAALLATSLVVGGFYAMVPALFLLGSALVRYGVIDRIDRSAREPALLAEAPLGRMALTNYLTATLLVLAAGHLIGGRPGEWSSTTVVLIAAFVLTAQWLFSACWVGRHRYGPVEWLWRWATWARRPPL
ncbi:DUF418 domain-containing protein [Nonomuraea wenchangensis]|uniref:DUF418 domain-containing protein n=1 Tax=Nonomuraea wenchangensis TaxID=568860 RepID=A0A1I0JNA5_9ACTN|nr:DUF418 domain-containing protein [Nonomuraea wenchangensis]SEU11914.1 Protein of unknown function [Nonomuraea wenchangensis]